MVDISQSPLGMPDSDRLLERCDNPVIWFDPSVPESQMRPYTLQLTSPVVLLFPISPRLMIYGHSSMRAQFASHGFRYSELTNIESVEIMNRQLCRFAYDAVFAQSPGQEELIREWVDTSPSWKHKYARPRAEGCCFFNKCSASEGKNRNGSGVLNQTKTSRVTLASLFIQGSRTLEKLTRVVNQQDPTFIRGPRAPV
jgi:hypothetical protein